MGKCYAPSKLQGNTYTHPRTPMNLVPTSGTFPVNTPLLESGHNLCDGVLHRQKVYMKNFTPEFKAKKSPFLNRSENV